MRRAPAATGYGCRRILVCLLGLLVAEFAAALTFAILLAIASHFGMMDPGSRSSAATDIGNVLFFSVVGTPFAIYLTCWSALIFIVIGEYLRRPTSYYPLGGAVVGLWQYASWPATPFVLSSHHARLGDFMTVAFAASGLVAGVVFWFIAVRAVERLPSTTEEDGRG